VAATVAVPGEHFVDGMTKLIDPLDAEVHEKSSTMWTPLIAEAKSAAVHPVANPENPESMVPVTPLRSIPLFLLTNPLAAEEPHGEPAETVDETVTNCSEDDAVVANATDAVVAEPKICCAEESVLALVIYAAPVAQTFPVSIPTVSIVEGTSLVKHKLWDVTAKVPAVPVHVPAAEFAVSV
jgi:hypothetical protein